MSRRPIPSHTDELAEKILLEIVPVYVRAHADHMASVFRDIDQVKAKTQEERAAAQMKEASVEKSLRGIGAGVVKMARYIAMEFDATGGELENALNRIDRQTTEIDLGNNARI